MRSVVQENNVKLYLDLFSDEQAMTLSELAILTKIYHFVSLQSSHEDSTVFQISLDASGWNNKFPSETAHPIMKNTLDNIFSNPIFSKTHNAYQASFIYVPDEIETLYWDGQLGGD